MIRTAALTLALALAVTASAGARTLAVKGHSWGTVPVRQAPVSPAVSLGARLQVCPLDGCVVPPNAAPLTASRGLATSLRLVARWWNEPPSCGAVTFWLADLGGDEVGSADDALCRVYIDRTFWVTPDDPSSIAYGSDPYTLCATLAHEYGHLLGYQHNSNPESIMAPSGDAQPLPCARRWPRLAEGGRVLASPR